jgi:protein FRG1
MIIPVPDQPRMFALQTARETFVEVDESKSEPIIRADAETINFSSTLRVRMQARFKPKRKEKKEEKVKDKISRKELEELAGRRLEDEDVKKLKRARRNGNFHEALLDVKVKAKHDKFA